MNYLNATFLDANQQPIGAARLPDLPSGWWIQGWRDYEYQSWERPFTAGLVANVSSDLSGSSMFADSGEAFVYFEQAPMSLPGMPGLFGMMPAMPSFTMPLPHTGRPERKFPGVGAYLDSCMRQALTNSMGDRPLRLVGETLVGQSAKEAAEREARDRDRLALDHAELNGRMFTYVVDKVLARTVMRAYEFTDDNGTKWASFLGATFYGYDLHFYPARLGITKPQGNYAFGSAPLGNAEIYQVLWMAQKRFGGSCRADVHVPNEFAGWVARFGSSAHFSEQVVGEMREREQAFKKRDSAQHQSDIQEMRRLNAEMREDNRIRQQRLDWERARSWERKLESDRRISERRSAVIRGVDQYVGPRGELIEMPMGGIGSRAYYDRFSGTILQTDGYPYGWEELPRWEW